MSVELILTQRIQSGTSATVASTNWVVIVSREARDE